MTPCDARVQVITAEKIAERCSAGIDGSQSSVGWPDTIARVQNPAAEATDAAAITATKTPPNKNRIIPPHTP
jgi:hypothetical protein